MEGLLGSLVGECRDRPLNEGYLGNSAFVRSGSVKHLRLLSIDEGLSMLGPCCFVIHRTKVCSDVVLRGLVCAHVPPLRVVHGTCRVLLGLLLGLIIFVA